MTSSLAGEPASDAAAAPPAGYRLVWADEFDTDGLPDPGRWSYDTMSNRSGWANEERQYYAAARRENSRVENSVLIIEARHEGTRAFEDSGGQKYTSARLVTSGHMSWTYGFFEIRAKLPCGRGTWPAIWMLADAPVINWPDIGEIDIMEQVGFDPGVVYGTIHTKAYNHVIHTARGDEVKIADACAAFHRYQLTWTPDRITIGADVDQFDTSGGVSFLVQRSLPVSASSATTVLSGMTAKSVLLSIATPRLPIALLPRQ